MFEVRFPVRKNIFILVAAGISLLLISPCRSGGSALPQKSKTQSRPVFRKVLSSEEYNRRFSDVLQRLGDLDALADSEIPSHGVRVVTVAEESQAEKGGVKPGDVIVKFGDALVWVKDMLPRSESSEIMEFYSQDERAMRSLRVEPEQLGITIREYWRPEVLYLHEPGRDPRWEQQVVVGLTTLISDPDLAETAWSHAIDNGYPRDHRSALAGGLIALGQGRTEAAARFAAVARDGGIESTLWYHPTMMYRLAIANGQITEALRVALKHRGAFEVIPELVQLLLDGNQQSANEPPSDSDLTRRAETMYRDNLLSRSSGRNLNSTRLLLPGLQRDGIAALSAPTAHFQILQIGTPEPIENFDLKMQFALNVHDDKTSRYTKNFSVTIYNDIISTGRESPVHNDTLLQTVFDEFSQVSLAHSNLPLNFSYHDPRFEIGEKHTHDLRMIRIRNRAEVFIDGKRVLAVPVKSQPVNLSFLVKVVGMDVKIRSFSLDELIDQP